VLSPGFACFAGAKMAASRSVAHSVGSAGGALTTRRPRIVAVS